MEERAISFLGLLLMVFLAWMLSDGRRKVNWRIVFWGIGFQFILAVGILKTPLGLFLFDLAQSAAETVMSFSDSGAKFLFGESFYDHFFAFKVLPSLIFFSSLSYILFYFGILQKIVEGLAKLLSKILRISGPEALVTTANIFVGQTEAPLFVKPYLKSMSHSEIMVMMTGGMATVAGGVLAAYVGLGISAGHLIAASLMSAPAAIVIAKIMVPEVETASTDDSIVSQLDTNFINFFDAACHGAMVGLKLAMNVGAMLIAFIAIIAFMDYCIVSVGQLIGIDVSFEGLLGYIFRPLAWCMGINWHDSFSVGQILGTKIVFNEFIAYSKLQELMDPGNLNQRSTVICTYALCGFANFGSIAVQIGGIGNLESSQKPVFARLGLKAMIGGNLAAFMTACIAGILV